MNKSPWRHGGLSETIVKFEDMGAGHIVRTLLVVREILNSLDAIEDEDARRTAAREASTKFQKAFSNGK